MWVRSSFGRAWSTVPRLPPPAPERQTSVIAGYMGGLGDESELLAKAHDGSPPSEVYQQFERIKQADPKTQQQYGGSWREAAKLVNFTMRDAYPKIHEFERSVLPSIRTLRAQFKCGLCKYCHRPMIDSLLPQHTIECERRIKLRQQEQQKQQQQKQKEQTQTKTEQQQQKHETKSQSEQKVSSSITSTSQETASVKRKRAPGEDKNNSDRKNWQNAGLGDGEEGVPTSKRAKTTKAKTPKVPKPAKQIKATKPPKQPKPQKQSKEKPVAVYNPDKNCGVLLPSAQPCMRSLTCKQHSMGAKRAVAGRSASYDVLLSNYHRQHQVKQAQLTASAAQAAQLESDQLQDAQAQQNPEREVHQVLEGVSRVFCAPLAKGRVPYTASRGTNFRLREMLAVALLPRRLPPTGDVLYGRSLAFRPETPEQLMYVRSQPVQQAMYISQMQQRQQIQLQLRRQAAANAIPNPLGGNTNGGANTKIHNMAQRQPPSTAPGQLNDLQRQHHHQNQQKQLLSARLSAQQQLQHRVNQSHNRNTG